jgi:hypothetical protein
LLSKAKSLHFSLLFASLTAREEMDVIYFSCLNKKVTM